MSALDLLFLGAAVAIVVAQLMILRSTARGMRVAPAERRGNVAVEWAFAIVPAIGVAALLFFSWQASHQERVTFEIVPEASAPAGPRT